MHAPDIIRLLALAAIWGGSFIFMKVLAPAIGAVRTADLRVLIAGILLVIYLRARGRDLEFRRFWRQYLVIGVVNSGIPFLCYTYAALHIPASYSVILNATAPAFGAIFAAIWLADRFTIWRFLGLLLGACGVALMSWRGPVPFTFEVTAAIAACLVATTCYGLAGVYMKKRASGAAAASIAACSQLVAGLLLFPATLFTPLETPLTPFLVANILALAVVCSALAYLLYYRLIVDIGPAKALTVTFLMPVFGMLWGFLFLDEEITLAMLAGVGLILSGTFVVARR
ncbi:DMT family transporter [Haliangium ochraceum]|nr:DMT family transporter [Haliangium ochraceum]